MMYYTIITVRHFSYIFVCQLKYEYFFVFIDHFILKRHKGIDGLSWGGVS
jgi:hypothetical protein